MSSYRAAGGLLCLLLAALAGCAIPVKVDYNSKAGIERCHSFAWQQSLTATPGGAFDNPINLQRLRTAVGAQLKARGIAAAAEGAAADCLVGTAIGARDTFNGLDGPIGLHAGLGFGSPWRRGGFGLGYDSAYLSHQGSVAVDFYDARTHEPLWHAVAQRDVTDSTGEYAQQRIDEAVRALFAQFPVASS